jgi:molecular chaperone DnaK (HSP70)
MSFILITMMRMTTNNRNLYFVQARTSILGIDIGSLYMKVALVQSGHPIEIVTNLHSKRKTEQMILFDGSSSSTSSSSSSNEQPQRFYGADAIALLQRKAHITPTSMTTMLGRNIQHPSIQVRWIFLVLFFCFCFSFRRLFLSLPLPFSLT